MFDRTNGHGDRIVLLSTTIGDYTHAVELRLSPERYPEYDEVAVMSFYKDTYGDYLDVLKVTQDTCDFPHWIRNRTHHPYDTAIIDSRVYCCPSWF